MQHIHKISGKMKASPVQFSDSDDLLDIRYDNIFKAVFTRDPRLQYEIFRIR